MSTPKPTPESLERAANSGMCPMAALGLSLHVPEKCPWCRAFSFVIDAAEADAVAKEREACASLCESQGREWVAAGAEPHASAAPAQLLSDAIRARGANDAD